MSPTFYVPDWSVFHTIQNFNIESFFEDASILPTQMYDKIIGLDFDGVIHTYDGWKGPDLQDLNGPVPGAKDFMSILKDTGRIIAIVTARPLDPIPAFLSLHGFDGNFDIITNVKFPCSCYIDDQVIPFNGSFEPLLEQVNNFKPWWRK